MKIPSYIARLLKHTVKLVFCMMPLILGGLGAQQTSAYTLSQNPYTDTGSGKFIFVVDTSLFDYSDGSGGVIVGPDMNFGTPRYYISKQYTKLPTSTGSFLVEWGDGTSDTYDYSGSTTNRNIWHVYQANGIYEIRVSGNFDGFAAPALSLYSTCDDYVGYSDSSWIDIKQWGNIVWKDMGVLPGHKNMVITARDAPNLQNITKFSFLGNYKFNNPINHWNVSSITDFRYTFFCAKTFNQPLNNWNISNATSLYAMFQGAAYFNQPIGSWDTSKVTDMSYMFNGATRFNQDISNWNISNVINTSWMFQDALLFNKPLATWNTSNLATPYGMFKNAISFNQPIGNWNTSKITSIPSMFEGAASFNQDLSAWDTSRFTSFQSTFKNAAAFNQPLSTWKTSSGVYFASMFEGASAFNQPLTTWNMSSATTLAAMFKNATAFNGDITNWDTSKVSDFRAMFQGASAFNQPIGNWNTAWYDPRTSAGASMDFMFMDATSFNQPLNWNTGWVTSFLGMFQGASAFNQPLTSFKYYHLASWQYFYNFLDYSGLSTYTYDQFLGNFAASKPNHLALGTLDARGLTWCNSEAARNTITQQTPYWTINDAGKDCTNIGTGSTNTGPTNTGSTSTGSTNTGSTNTGSTNTGSDTTPPVLTLNGPSPMIYTLGTTYTDPGAICIDAVSGNCTASITSTSSVNTSVIGVYSITYTGKDAAGNKATIIRQVQVVSAGTGTGSDTTPPVLTLLGANSYIITVGTSWVEPGYTCMDSVSGNCTSTVITVSTLNTNVIGNYTINYTGQDTVGNRTLVTRQIQVIAGTNTSPSIPPTISSGPGGPSYTTVSYPSVPLDQFHQGVLPGGFTVSGTRLPVTPVLTGTIVSPTFTTSGSTLQDVFRVNPAFAQYICPKGVKVVDASQVQATDLGDSEIDQMIRQLIMYRAAEQDEARLGAPRLTLYRNTGIFLNRPQFEKTRPITRAEFIKVLVRSLPCRYTDVGGETGYSDVDSRVWYAPYIAFAKQNGWLKGMTSTDGRFRPHGAISGSDMTRILVKALRLEEENARILLQYANIDSPKSGIRRYVDIFANLGFIDADKKIYFGSSSSYITRADTAKILYNLLF